MTSGKVEVREKSTGQVYVVWPVDARALLGSGEYEPADALTARIAAGKPAYPLKRDEPSASPPQRAPEPEASAPVAPAPVTAAEGAAAPEPKPTPRKRGSKS